jgi:hypothetical protein
MNVAAGIAEDLVQQLEDWTPGQEFHDANPDAGDREFLTTGR